jgi:ATP-dependent Lon protease
LIALGGTGDASFLEGHSYTYEGSSWGKIVQILIDGKCMNPVIYFDELDKVSDTARGQEIVGVLTHLTDTTQNNQFHDKYFSEIDFDLSKCLFIFSYNDEELVNPILRDRMYCIQTAGYDVAQKVVIAKQYLLPKIRAQVNFQEGDVVLPDEVLRYIISNERITQKEDGVRNLKRCLEIIHTKLNLFRLIHTADPKIEAVVNANVETVVDPKVVLKVVLKDGQNDTANWFLGKDMPLNVSFPYTVTSKDVDILIRHDEKQNHSLLSMYV